jgi:hypothetical protein
MTRPTDDQLDAYLRQLPAPDPDPAAATVARAQLERHLAAARSTAAGNGATRRRFTAFAGLATAGAAAGVLVLVGGGSAGRPDPAVAAEMDKIARAAHTRAADPVIGPGKAWYVRSILLSETTVALGQNAGLPGPSREVKYQQPELREAWFRPDAPGHLKTRYTGKIRMLAGKESDIPSSILHDSQPTPQGDVLDPGIQIPFGGDLLTLEQSRELPTDPHDLLSEIRDAAGDAGPDPDSEAFTVIGDALRETPIGRDLRVALLRTVGLIPGVSIRHGRDSKGRIAAIASHTNDGGRSELYLDPEDGTLLEERTVSTGKDGVAAGTLLYRSTLDVAGVVDGVGVRPRR